ncbi:MAG: glycosyltransferase [Bacteroidia bacterium]|nr:glycosyltransferase [Bacteroidia bacterium]MDW8015591.1 glycosyltransferase [Bacteroidia bacterium]
MTKVRVLYLISRLNIGGPAHHVLLLSRDLDSERYEKRLVAGQEPQGEVRAEEWIKAYGVDVEYLPSLERDPSFLKDLRAFLWLLRLMRSWKPHIVHTHTAKAGALGRLAAWITGVPVRIHTFHGHSLEGYFSPKVSFLYRLIERFLARLTHRIIVLSKRQQEDIVKRFRIAPSEKVMVLPLIFDLNRLKEYDEKAVIQLRREWQGDASVPILAWIGRMVPIKRVDRLIEAAAQLHSEGIAFRLVLVGDGPERQGWEALAARLKLPAIWTGIRWDIPVILRAVDAILLTSDNEGTPAVLIEALACGTAVASTPVGGVPDLLEEGRWGWLLYEPLTDSLRVFLQHLSQAQQKARAAASYIQARYGTKPLLQALDRLYQDLLQCR